MAASRIAQLVASRDAVGLVAACETIEFEQSIFLANNLPLDDPQTPADAVSPSVVATALLAAFLVLNDLDAARFLVKRTGAEMRTPAFEALAAVAMQLWNRDYEAVHVALAAPALSSTAADLAEWVRAAVRQRIVALIATAYTSIPTSQFAATMGVPHASGAAAAAALGWRCEGEFVYPDDSDKPPAADAVGGLAGAHRPGLDRIALLAEYANRLETLQ